MADKQIGALAAAAALDGTELVHVVQGGNSRRSTTAAIANSPAPDATGANGVETPYTWSVTIGDDQVFQIDFGADVFALGLEINGNTSGNSALIGARTTAGTSFVDMLVANNQYSTGTTVLTAGTSDGVDGDINIHANGQSLYIKNRLGFTFSPQITVKQATAPWSGVTTQLLT